MLERHDVCRRYRSCRLHPRLRRQSRPSPLEHALAEEHNLAWNDDWTSADRHGHGTEMAGLALYGPQLGELLLAAIVPSGFTTAWKPSRFFPTSERTIRPIMARSPSAPSPRSKSRRPIRPRVICMAITAPDKDQCLPTLWSASLDQMCSGAIDDHRRLMFVSAGNFRDEMTVDRYPEANHNASVQDPAQAWNVVTVGAYTEKVMISDPDLPRLYAARTPGRPMPNQHHVMRLAPNANGHSNRTSSWKAAIMPTIPTAM